MNSNNTQNISEISYDNFEDLTDDAIQRLNGDKLIEAGIKALNKPPTQRGKTQINILLRLTEEIQFFKNHFGANHQALLSEYSEYFGYQRHTQGQTVFKQNDLGDKFYLILRGKVKVVVNVKRQQIKEAQGGKSIKKFDVIEQVEIKELKSGETFGELALIDQKPRGATIICTEDCDFITFEKESFIKILKDQETIKLREEIQQLNKIYLLKDFSLNLLKNIYLLFTINNYQRGDQLFKEGDQSEKLYIIREGEFKISKRFEFQQDELKLNKLNNNERKNRVLNLDIGLIGKLQPLGEEEFFLGGIRQVTAVCVSKDALVMAINKKDLLRKMSYDQNSLRLMYNRAKEKNEYREQKLKQLKEKHEDDEEVLLMKNFSKNKFKLSNKIELSDDMDISEFTEINPHSPSSAMQSKQNKGNFVLPSNNTIRPKSSTLQQLGLKMSVSQIDQPSPRLLQSQSQTTRGESLSFSKNPPRLLAGEKSQEGKNRYFSKEYDSTENSLSVSIFRSRNGSMQNTIQKNISEIKEHDDEGKDKSNVSHFSTILSDIKDTTQHKQDFMGQHLNSSELKQLSLSQNKKTSLFSPQPSNQNTPKKRKITLKINDKLQEGRKDSNSEEEQPTPLQLNMNGQENQNNEDYQQNQNTPQSQLSQFGQNRNKQLSLMPLSTKSTTKKSEFYVHKNNEVKSYSNIPKETDQMAISAFSNLQEIEDSYYKGIYIEDENEMNKNRVSLFNSKVDVMSQSQQIISQENQLHYSVSLAASQNLIKQQSNSQVSSKQQSKRDFIIYQDKTRQSILTNKCKDFILNVNDKKILEKAKAKSIQKNPFLYIDEFPLAKNVQTNLEDQDIDRLISEKIISSVIRGKEKRGSFLQQSPNQQSIEKKQSIFADVTDNNKGSGFTPKNSDNKLQQQKHILSNSNDNSFQDFLNQRGDSNETEREKAKSAQLPQQQQSQEQQQQISQSQQTKALNTENSMIKSSSTPKQIQIKAQAKKLQLSHSLSNPYGIVNNSQDEGKPSTPQYTNKKRNLVRPQTALQQPVTLTTETDRRTKSRGSVGGQMVRLLSVPDDLNLKLGVSHSQQLNLAFKPNLDKSNIKSSIDEDLTTKLTQLATLSQNLFNLQSPKNIRPKSSSSAVFKHGFKSNPCQQVNNQVFHIYNCKEKNDGRCLCQSNHLNFLPLKFRTEMILQNSLAVKKHNFSVRMQGRLYQKAS